MKNKPLVTVMSAVLSLGVISACGTDNDNNLNDPDNVNYRPARNDQDDMIQNDRNRLDNRNNGARDLQLDGDDRNGVLDPDDNDGNILNNNDRDNIFDNDNDNDLDLNDRNGNGGGNTMRGGANSTTNGAR